MPAKRPAEPKRSAKAAAKPKRAAKKAAQPRSPPAKAKTAKPAKPTRSAKAKGPGQGKPRRARSKVEPRAPPPVSADPAWVPVEDSAAAAWPAPARAATARPPPPPFDPVTGDWVPVPAATPATPPVAAAGAVAWPPAPDAPEAPRRDAVATVWHVILAIDLLLLAVNFLLALALGAVLVFAPDSAEADEVRETFEGSGGSQFFLVLETLIAAVMMGLVPFLWVVFTRRGGWAGAKRYLQLHTPARSFLVGLLLTGVLLAAVIVMSVLYILLTEGTDGLTLEEEGENPAVDALLEGLTWPVAILVALVAGVGEEILFRGVLFRQLGLWPQAILFGLAHAAGGYLPQILFAFFLAILFGYLLRRGVSMYALMTAHFLYDLTLLSLAVAYA